MLTALYKMLPERYLAIILGITYCIGTLSTQHYSPAAFDLIPNLESAIFLNIALIPFIWKKNNIKIPMISVGILCFLLLIIIQPFISQEPYPDTLIFPLGALSSAFMISIIIYNHGINNKKIFLETLACFFITSAIGNSFSLIAQNFFWIPLNSWLVFFSTSLTRPEGNIAQPNQAAFIIALGFTSITYFFTKNKNKLIIKLLFFMLYFLLSIGLGLTASRAGLIFISFIFIAFYIYSLCNKSYFKKELTVLLMVSILGYFTGIYLLAHGHYEQLSAIARITQAADNGTRTLLQKQALLLFSQHPIAGVGYGNFIKSGLENVDKLSYFSYVNNSHFFFTQIASELGTLGLICLIPFLFVTMKNIKIKSYYENYLNLIFIGIFVLYSLSEYPLWYYRFLIIFIAIFSILKQPCFTINFNLSKPFLIISLMISVTSIYYYHQYYKYAYTYLGMTKTTDKKIQIQMVHDTPSIFGFSELHDLLVFLAQPLNKENIKEKVNLGNTVLTRFPSPEIMLYQAIFLGLDNQPKKSIYLLQAICKYKFSSKCQPLLQNMEKVRDAHPKEFSEIYQRISTDFPKYAPKN